MISEYHKGKMQSVVKNSLAQIQSVNYVKLFKSYNIKFKNGQQIRDFIYVNDCISVIIWFMKKLRNLQNHILIMKLIEYNNAEIIFKNPKDEYTKNLIQSVI